MEDQQYSGEHQPNDKSPEDSVLARLRERQSSKPFIQTLPNSLEEKTFLDGRIVTPEEIARIAGYASALDYEMKHRRAFEQLNKELSPEEKGIQASRVPEMLEKHLGISQSATRRVMEQMFISSEQMYRDIKDANGIINSYVARDIYCSRLLEVLRSYPGINKIELDPFDQRGRGISEIAFYSVWETAEEERFYKPINFWRRLIGHKPQTLPTKEIRKNYKKLAEIDFSTGYIYPEFIVSIYHPTVLSAWKNVLSVFASKLGHSVKIGIQYNPSKEYPPL